MSPWWGRTRQQLQEESLGASHRGVFGQPVLGGIIVGLNVYFFGAPGWSRC